ncbi:MAG TPA: hypothetical protein DIC56_07675 [Rhizobium sp.]|nr:hypothetical protein [Rhizobium sp.]
MVKLPDQDGFLSVGDVTGKSLQVRYGLPSHTDIGELVAAGAVGDPLGRYLDAEGRPIDHPLNRQVISPDLLAYRGISNCIIASGGPHKRAILRTTTKAGAWRECICARGCPASTRRKQPLPEWANMHDWRRPHGNLGSRRANQSPR